MLSKKLSAIGSPRGVLFCGHLRIVYFGFDVRMSIKEPREQQAHLPTVPAVELYSSRIQRPHLSHYSSPLLMHECHVWDIGLWILPVGLG
jgi:hypothetical protein